MQTIPELNLKKNHAECVEIIGWGKPNNLAKLPSPPFMAGKADQEFPVANQCQRESKTLDDNNSRVRANKLEQTKSRGIKG